MTKRHLRAASRLLWGRKGGESGPPGEWTAPREGFWWIPKSLPIGLKGMPPEWLMLILWMMWLTWEEARRRNEARQPETEFHVVASAQALAEGTGLDEPQVETALAEMAAAGWVEPVSAGWRLVRWTDDPAG